MRDSATLRTLDKSCGLCYNDAIQEARASCSVPSWTPTCSCTACPIATLIDKYLAREHFVLLTGATLPKELDRLLRYPRLQRYYTEETRTRFVALIAALSEVIELPESVPRIHRDPGDDWVIACTVVGQAGAIVSGDRDLLALGAEK